MHESQLMNLSEHAFDAPEERNCPIDLADCSSFSLTTEAAGSRVHVPTRRHRATSTRKASVNRYDHDPRSNRQVSPEAIELAEAWFATANKLNSTRQRALFHAVKILLHYHGKEGIRLAQKIFSSEKVGRTIQEGFVESGLAKCEDWDSWKPTCSDLRNAKSRAFIPCFDLLWADTSEAVISTYSDYCAGRYQQREALHQSTQLVFPASASGVTISDNVVQALQRGTGLYCDFPVLRAALLCEPESKRSRLLGSALASVGRFQVDELQPIWKQHEWGRLYCSKPASINMPKSLLPALRSIAGLPLWNVDFSSFELRIACQICGQPLTEDDAYQPLADLCGISRTRVKRVVNPMLHGQTRPQLWYAQKPDRRLIADRALVEREMAHSLPQLTKGLESLWHEKSTLQRYGAALFFSCMGAAIQRCEIASVGLPKHDGWIFAATESQAKAVQEVFIARRSGLAACIFRLRST